MHLRSNGDYFSVQQLLIGFCNRDGVCILRGVKWIFKCNSSSAFFLWCRWTGWPCNS